MKTAKKKAVKKKSKKEYVVYDDMNSDFNRFSTKDQAEKYLKNLIQGYSPAEIEDFQEEVFLFEAELITFKVERNITFSK